MTEPNEEAIDSETLALLRADFAPASAAVKERVSTRLAQSVGAAALRRPPTPIRAAGASELWRALRAYPLGFAATFALGVAFGSGLLAATRRLEPPQIVYVDRVGVPPAASQIASAPVNLEPPVSAAEPVSQPARSVVSPSASVDRGSASLAEQQALLDTARTAFAHSDYSAALAALSAHFRRYPKSVLREEREALEIKALAASERTTEAKVLAVRFKAQYPQSLLLPSVTDSVGAIP